jgi:hypothetical protein
MARLCPLQVQGEIRSLQTQERCKAGRPAARPAAATEWRLLQTHGVLREPYLQAARRMGMAKVRTRRRISTPERFGRAKFTRIETPGGGQRREVGDFFPDGIRGHPLRQQETCRRRR